MLENNINITGPEARFILRLLSDTRILYRGNGVYFVARLLEKFNNLHLNQPLNQDDEEALRAEQIILSSIVFDKEA
jgi:hypothetical protein